MNPVREHKLSDTALARAVVKRMPWTSQQKERYLQRRGLNRGESMTAREYRAKRRAMDAVINAVVAEMKPHVTDGVFEQADTAYENRQGIAAIDMVLHMIQGKKMEMGMASPPPVQRTCTGWYSEVRSPSEAVSYGEWEK